MSARTGDRRQRGDRQHHRDRKPAAGSLPWLPNPAKAILHRHSSWEARRKHAFAKSFWPGMSIDSRISRWFAPDTVSDLRWHQGRKWFASQRLPFAISDWWLASCPGIRRMLLCTIPRCAASLPQSLLLESSPDISWPKRYRRGNA